MQNKFIIEILTIFVKEELVETKAAGFLPYKAVHVFGAVIVNRNRVF